MNMKSSDGNAPPHMWSRVELLDWRRAGGEDIHWDAIRQEPGVELSYEVRQCAVVINPDVGPQLRSEGRGRWFESNRVRQFGIVQQVLSLSLHLLHGLHG